MACSDNVVRAGLTPKFKDVDTLCEMLDYKCGTKEENIFPCHKDPSDQYVTIYDPPVADFAVARIHVSCKECPRLCVVIMCETFCCKVFLPPPL